MGCYCGKRRKGLEGKRVETVLCKLVLSASVYNIRRKTNNITHRNHLLIEEKLSQKIRLEVRTWVMFKGRFQRSKENEELSKNWDLLESIFKAETE